MGFQVSKLNSTCVKCGNPITKGDRIWWTLEARGLEHATCHGPEPVQSRAEPVKRRGRITDAERCVMTKKLFGQVMRCTREKHEDLRHFYEFTSDMGRRFWARLKAAPGHKTLQEIFDEDKEYSKR